MNSNRADPYTELHTKLTEIVSRRTGEDPRRVSWLITPPRKGYGDLSIPLVRFSRRHGISPDTLFSDILSDIKDLGLPIEKASLEKGYMNLALDVPELVKRLSAMLSGGWTVRIPPIDNPLRIVVEHTSANPIHPLHIGHARNTSIGDTLARMLEARGHIVNTRFYIDDVGKQVAIVAYGFKVLGVDPLEEARKLNMKPDHLVGWVYATTFTLLDIARLKREIDGLTDDQDKKTLLGKLDELIAIAAGLKERDPGSYFDKLLAGLEPGVDHEAEIQKLMQRYERGLEPERSLVRRVTGTVLEGFKETLSRLEVEFDDWDWESDIVWSSRVAKIIEEAKKSPYYIKYKGTDAIDIPRIIEEVLERDLEARNAIRIPKGWEIPPLILVRADGTTLYTTRDLAYTLYKFEEFSSDKVVNVIGADQRLAQLQLRLALLGLGYKKEALNLIHYDYEIVSLPGQRMSSRRGKLVDLDGILDSLHARASLEVRKRNPEASEEWVDDVAWKIAVGALRFALVRTNARRPIVFDPERALNLEENSGPYLQYTHARAVGILRKHGPVNYDSIDYSQCNLDKRRTLILKALRYPLTAAKAIDDMAPEDLASYLLKLADEFNSWYQVDPVIRETNEGARECKALIVELLRQTLRDGLSLLGVPTPDRM
ncbi:MAG: arginine--tRNA ligase [Desulfurococcales archaeon]|nr:arginine--tRNA ligase [Desulfurococcales archaeon]